MKLEVVVRILLLLAAFFLQADAGCFPCRKRKTVTSAKTSMEKTEEGRIAQNLRADDSPTVSQAQMVERAVETVKEDELEEGRRREARSGAIRILAQVLNDLTERPRSYRREYFGYCVMIQWSLNPIMDGIQERNHEKKRFGGLMPILAFGQLFGHPSIIKDV